MNSCPICESPAIKQPFMQFSYAYKEYSLSQCTTCKCVFYETDFFFDFKENFEHNRNLKTYLEKTSDIESLITVMHNFFSRYPDRTQAGIDIGCGAGLIMDFSEKMMFKKMIGFEPSSHYSKEGKTTLGLNIIEDFFSAEKLDGQKTDFIVCFQVIQLVTEPRLLLKEIKDLLTNKGILLLSTPDSDSLNPKSNFADHLSTLSPGVHRTIFNAQNLEKAMKKTGFQNVQVFKRNGQLFVLASDEPLLPINIFEMNRQIVLDYYIKKLEELPDDSSYFKGVWYRLYRNRIDNGEYREAIELLKNADWFELWSENEIEAIKTLDKLYELNSSADAVIYYYAGILFLNHLQKNNYAEKFFLLSFLLCRKIIQIQPDMSMIEQDIVWLAKLHQILVQLNQGKTQDAHGELILMLSNGLNASDYLPPLVPEIRSRAENLMKQIK